jgi:hypothetical protein
MAFQAYSTDDGARVSPMSIAMQRNNAENRHGHFTRAAENLAIASGTNIATLSAW